MIQLMPAPQLRQQAISQASGVRDPVATLAASLLADSHLVVALRRAVEIPASSSMQQSLSSFGDDVVPSTAEVIAALVTTLPRVTPSLLITCTQPSMRAGDELCREMPWCITQGDHVYIHSPLERVGANGVPLVIRMSEGYPAGIVLIHEGSLTQPTRPVWACMSAFDGDTFIAWWTSH